MDIELNTITNKHLPSWDFAITTSGVNKSIAPTFSGTEICRYYDGEAAFALTTASTGITSTSMAISVGDTYLNSNTSDVYVCTTAGTARTARWTWLRRLRNDCDNENVLRFFSPETPYAANSQPASIEAEVVEGETPFGTQGKLLHISRNGTATIKYTYYTPYTNKYFKIDNTKTYRYVAYFKQDAAVSGFRNYFGIKGHSTAAYPILSLDGSSKRANAYYVSLTSTDGNWYVIIGYITAHGTTTASSGSGVYKMDGTKVYDCTNYQWNEDVNSTFHFGTLCLHTDTADLTTTPECYLYNIRFEPLDENAPSWESLFDGSYLNKSNVDCKFKTLDGTSEIKQRAILAASLQRGTVPPLRETGNRTAELLTEQINLNEYLNKMQNNIRDLAQTLEYKPTLSVDGDALNLRIDGVN